MKSAGARLVLDALYAAFFLLELRSRVRSRANRRGVAAEHRSLTVLVVTLVAGLVGAFLAAAKLESLAIHAGRWPLFVLGALLMAAGIAFRQWAIVTLGDYFTVDVRVRPDQAVVEAGPYRWVCHPAYTGLIMVFLGTGLMLGNWASLALAVLLPTAGLLYRIRAEERALLAGLGDPYRRFLASRARLAPGIW